MLSTVPYGQFVIMNCDRSFRVISERLASAKTCYGFGPPAIPPPGIPFPGRFVARGAMRCSSK
jgi:hypothetical protein